LIARGSSMSHRDARVTRLTEALAIGFVVRLASVSDRVAMMDFVGEGDVSLRGAVLTERVTLEVPEAIASPSGGAVQGVVGGACPGALMDAARNGQPTAKRRAEPLKRSTHQRPNEESHSEIRKAAS